MSIGKTPEIDRTLLRPKSTYLLFITAHAIRSEMEQKLKPLALTGMQFSVLSMIESNGGMSSAAISRRFFVTPQTMNETIIALEKRDLLERHADPSNARVRRIKLTPEGAALVAQCDALVDEVEGRAFAALDDAELGMLRSLTARVFEHWLHEA